MNSALISTLIPLAIVAIVPIILAYLFVKKFRMPDYGVSYWIILFAIFFGVTVVATSYNRIKLGIDLRGGSILVYEVSQSAAEQLEQEMANPNNTVQAQQDGSLSSKMDKLSSTLKKRLDPGGVKEITVRQRGSNAVEIIIPEVDSTEIARLKKIVSRSGTLEFRILADNDYPEDRQLIELANKSEDRFVKASTGVDEKGNPTFAIIGMWIPITENRENEFTGRITRDRVIHGKTVKEILCKKDIYDVTGRYLTDASVGIDQQGKHCVNFRFNTEGANRFGKLTSNNTPNVQQNRYRLLGIVLDDAMYSAPRINSPIHDRGEITGNFTDEEARELAAVLNAGSLPASLSKEPISEMTSGPTLGKDTIERGKYASGFALLAVLIFMAFYYRFAGLVADLALVLNLVLLVALMITFSAAFTLPGIAGLVMSLGMAVDANVLIYERMREEKNKGATIRMAIRNGFQKAFSAIFDSNITTLLVGVILYWVGTEQIKGFAVTLILGIGLSMFTALFCAKVIFETAERNRILTELHMLRIVGKTNIDFMGLMGNTTCIAIILCVISAVAIVSRGTGLLDIDFTGGSSVQVLFNEPVSIDVVRKELSELENLAVSDVQISGEQKGIRYMVNSSSSAPRKGEAALEGEEYINHVTQLIKEKFPNKLATNDIAIKSCAPYSEKEAITSALTEKTTTQNSTSEEGAKDATEVPKQTTTLNSIFDLFTSTAYADDPVAETPAAPAEETPAAPAEETPAAPAEETPAAPAEETPAAPAAPAEETPAAPAEEAPTTPAEETPAAPAEETPAAPAEETPAAPAEETPAAPAEETPAAPAEETPAAPAEETPAAPAEETPAAPVEETPAAPVEETPAAPVEETPAAPAAETPAAPVEEAPAAPAEEEMPPVPSIPEATENPSPIVDNGAVEASAPVNNEYQTFAVIEFKEPVTYDVVKSMIDDAMEAEKVAEEKRNFELENPLSEDSKTASFNTWQVSLTLSPENSQKVLNRVKSTAQSEPVFPARNMIGPQVAGDLRVQGLMAIFGSLIVMVVYLWFRFQKIYYGFAATAALCNNVILSVGALAISSYVCGVLGFLLIDPFKIGLTVLAGIMTIIGYSLNDTIVVFDRIREVKGKAPRITPVMVNQAINDMLARTILTSLTTLLVIIVLYVWGGQAIHAFAFTMLVGVVVGTFSSIFIAAPLLCKMDSMDTSNGTSTYVPQHDED